VGEGRSRDGDIGKIDEAGCLKALEDGLGGFELLGRGAIEEFGEVNELCGCVSSVRRRWVPYLAARNWFVSLPE
jgi:hypothetical protein